MTLDFRGRGKALQASVHWETCRSVGPQNVQNTRSVESFGPDSVIDCSIIKILTRSLLWSLSTFTNNYMETWLLSCSRALTGYLHDCSNYIKTALQQFTKQNRQAHIFFLTKRTHEDFVSHYHIYPMSNRKTW
jgi:hypothetical protein